MRQIPIFLKSNAEWVSTALAALSGKKGLSDLSFGDRTFRPKHPPTVIEIVSVKVGLRTNDHAQPAHLTVYTSPNGLIAHRLIIVLPAGPRAHRVRGQNAFGSGTAQPPACWAHEDGKNTEGPPHGGGNRLFVMHMRSLRRRVLETNPEDMLPLSMAGDNLREAIPAQAKAELLRSADDGMQGRPTLPPRDCARSHRDLLRYAPAVDLRRTHGQHCASNTHSLQLLPMLFCACQCRGSAPWFAVRRTGFVLMHHVSGAQ